MFSNRLFEVYRLLRTKKAVQTELGSIGYTSGTDSPLHVPEHSAVTYNININRQQPVSGIHIDSHQPIPLFQQVSTIPTTMMSPETAYNSYNGDVVQKYAGGHTGYTPLYRMKEALISMAVFGEGNSSVQPNHEVLEAYRDFVKVLRAVLPDSLGFLDLSIRAPDVVIVTRSGEFIIDAASGGLMTLIDLAWRLHMFSLTQSSFVVTMDEPENHLHPTMQRSLMPKLLTAFPQAQFIIATHSPFMVSSVKDSNVYALRYVASEANGRDQLVQTTDTNRVVSNRLDTINKAANASEILREVLGVSATIPEWVEEGVGEVVERFRNEPLSLNMLKRLREEMARLGYDDLYPDALARLTQAV